MYTAIIAVCLYFGAFFFLSQTEHQMCDVESIVATFDGSQSSYVYTDCGDFVLEPVTLRNVTPENTTNMLDVMRVDRPFTITTVGYRISPLNIYPSIIAVR